LPTLFKNVNTLLYPNQAKDAFNKYFLSLIEGLNLTDVRTDSALSYLICSYSNSFPSMTVIPVTEAEIVGLIGSPKNKKQ
jgi:hypothetical protein